MSCICAVAVHENGCYGSRAALLAGVAMDENSVAAVDEGGDARDLCLPHVEERDGFIVGVVDSEADVGLIVEAKG